MNGLNDIVAQDAKEAGKWFSRDNLFLNSDFTHAVNQSGQTEFTRTGYTFDGWFSNCNEQYPLTINENGLRVLSNLCFGQRIEASEIDESKIYTVSVLFSDGTLAYGSFMFPKTDSVSLPITSSGWTVVAYAKGSLPYYWLYIYKWNGNTDLYACAAKLEKGPDQTLAHKENGVWVQNRRPDPRLELLKCQSFYLPLSLNSDFAGVNWGNGMYFFVPTPVQMRANPILRPAQAAMVYHNGGATRVEISDFNTTTTSVSNGVQIFVKGKEEIPIGNCVLAELQGAFDACL